MHTALCLAETGASFQNFWDIGQESGGRRERAELQRIIISVITEFCVQNSQSSYLITHKRWQNILFNQQYSSKSDNIFFVTIRGVLTQL